MHPPPSGLGGMPLIRTGLPASATASSGSHNSSSNHSSSSIHQTTGVPYTRLTVGSFSDSGVVSLLSADKQSFSLPASLIPGELPLAPNAQSP